MVCIDPPFAKNETFGKKSDKAKDPLKPPLTQEERENELRLMASWGIHNEKDADDAGVNWPETRYKDFWSWEKDIHEDWLNELEESHKPVADLIDVTRDIHGDGTAAYLCYMAVRLLEIHRVLKPTGSLYLHCDHTAGAYLRQLLDAIFGNGQNGKAGFRNEIVWKRYGSHNDAAVKYGNVHDCILFYSKSEKYTWPGTEREPYDEEYLKRAYSNKDSTGKYTTAPLHARGLAGGGYDYTWRGVTDTWRFPTERLDELARQGLIHWPKNGQIPRRKVYLAPDKGTPLRDLITDIGIAGRTERTGYPTQKPVALAERIIAASSNPGDVVLDCFAGCAYTAVAAERLGRRWVACDINPRAWTVFKRQFNKPSLALLTCHDMTTGQQVLGDNPTVTIHGPNQLPVRTSPETEGKVRDLKLPERKFKVPASIIPEPEMLGRLLELSDYTAWCCGFANRKPDGSVIKTTRNFHLDHIAPKSKEGTSNEIQNRAPMCPYHNIRKNNRQIALSQYRQEIADAGEMMVNSVNELINLDYALAEAMKMYGQAYAARHPQTA